MAKERTTFSVVINSWAQLLTGLVANAADFVHLDEHRIRLGGLLDRTRTLVGLHDFHTANKQQAAKELKEVLGEGSRLATFLRTGVKDRYGNRAEKLIEFGVQPLRRRRRDSGELKEPAPSPAPSNLSNG